MCPHLWCTMWKQTKDIAKALNVREKKFLYKGRNTGGHYSLDDLV